MSAADSHADAAGAPALDPATEPLRVQLVRAVKLEDDAALARLYAQVEAFLKARGVTRDTLRAELAVQWNDGVLDDDGCAVMAFLFTSLADKLQTRGTDGVVILGGG